MSEWIKTALIIWGSLGVGFIAGAVWTGHFAAMRREYGDD